MKAHIEILYIGEPDEWGDCRVAFFYALGQSMNVQSGWLIEIVNIEGMDDLPHFLTEYVNWTCPPSSRQRWIHV